MNFIFRILFLSIGFSIYGQNNQITIDAQLHADKNILNINQQITYYNTSKDTLHQIVLRNWGNSYKDNKSPLAKRLLGDYKTNFYFSRNSDRGYSQVSSIKTNNIDVDYHSPQHQQDLIFLNLKEPLKPNENINLSLIYTVKIPNAKFTGNGKKKMDYYLEDWHITPAPYEDKWVLDSHNNLNYQFNTVTDYNINFRVPIGYQVHSTFEQEKIMNNEFLSYKLKGNNYVKANVSITFLKSYLTVNTNTSNIITDFISEDFHTTLQEYKMKQMLLFLEDYLGELSHKQILVEKEIYKQNPIYELKYLPEILHPYREQFKWEIKFFKTLSSEYIDQIILNNKYKHYCFNEGLEVYLFTKYIDKYYPESKITGRLADIWGVKSTNIGKSKFNDKFSITYQITARENLDQSLNTPLKDLSNYNKKVITPYKAGLSFLFLENYIGTEILDKNIKEFTQKNIHTISNPSTFINTLNKQTDKNISWFMNDWANKKIDHTISKADFKKDSVYIILKNKRSIKTPVSIYGLKNNKIVNKTWTNGFEKTKKIAIKNDHLDKVVLNYENDYPEINNRNNWKNSKTKLYERPIKIKLLKDLNDPNVNQVFLNPEADYNLYDGIILGLGIQNKAFIFKNFEYILKPTYSTANNKLTGSFGFKYSVYPEITNIYNINFGINGSNYQYEEDLNYYRVNPFFSMSFKPKNYRELGTNKLSARFLFLDKDVAKGTLKTEEDKYNLLKIDYVYNRNKLVNYYKLNVSTEITSKFSKLNTEFRYRHLTTKKRPIEVRFFGGIFFTNNTSSDYFSFNQHTANDYLFELPYLGRSEETGIYSQQYIRAQGGFVYQNDDGFSNQWLTTINTSVGIYKWIETFNNISLLKDSGSSSYFDYETGIRLNFVPDILEFYLPIYNKNKGFLVADKNYLKSVRFSITLKAQPLIKFFRQQFF